MARPVLSVVVWLDAWADSGDSTTVADSHLKHRATTMQTIGWVLNDDAEGISIFNERCLDQGEESYRSRTFIPRPLIKSNTHVSLNKPRKPREKIHPASVAAPVLVLSDIEPESGS